MFVRIPELRDDFRRHALAYMRFGQLVVHHEYMRLDHLLLLTDDPTNRRALQFSASAAATGSGIAERFLTNRDFCFNVMMSFRSSFDFFFQFDTGNYFA